MWGSLSVPKYIAHVIYADNAAGQTALKAGEVDVCQQFIANIQDLWLEDGLPISTYLDEAPWGICVNMPTAWFNLDIPALQCRAPQGDRHRGRLRRHQPERHDRPEPDLRRSAAFLHEPHRW
jgi:hypothetical protein